MRRKKALLIIKLSVIIAVILIVVMFSIIIAQTVKIKELEDEIQEQQIEYSSIAE